MRSLLLLVSLFSSTAAAQTCSAPYNAGFRILNIGGIKTGVWYPTGAAESKYSYSPQLSSTLALNGPVADCGTLPLVVFSHGFGGCGTQSIFFTEQLARSGFIVAAPDHKDALCSVDGSGAVYTPTDQPSFLDPKSWTDATYADRRDDIEKVLDGMLGGPEFGSHIDKGRIAGAGHSLGGYTIAGLVGAWPSWKDDRIKAAVLLSPYLLPFTAKNLISGIDIPVMYQGGQLDITITPFIQGDQGAYAKSNAPKFFVDLIAATHFEWTNFICANIPTVQSCLQSKGNARLIDSYAVSFLNRYVNNVKQPLLISPGQGVAAYLRVTQVLNVSGASFTSAVGAAPESVVTSFGDGIASNLAVAAAGAPLPSSLAGVTVAITDSHGQTRNAPLYFVSPDQINYLVPSDVAPGSANVSVKLSGAEIAAGSVQIDRTAPALFSAKATGQGIAAARFVRVPTKGDRTEGLIFDPTTITPVPIDVTGDPVYIELYGTGLRFGSATATVGGVDVPVQGPVAQNQYPGLDQINIGPLPRSLAGRGTVPVIINEGGKTTNTVTISIR